LNPDVTDTVAGIEVSQALPVLSLAKLLYGANVFEISNIQKMKLKPAAKANRNVTMLPWVGNRRMEFSVCTDGQYKL
jgi:hypothetical protein